MRPRVSVVIRTYNRAPLLGPAIDSVLAQSVPADEVLVVDDGSSDATPSVLANYAGQVEHLRLPHTGNPAAVLNAGLRAARGELIAVLDSDDLWLPTKLEQQLARLATSERVGFVYGNVCLLSDDGRRSAPVLRPEQIGRGWILPIVVRDMCVHPSTLLVRRELVERVGPLDERERVNEDFFLVLRLARLAEAACVPEPVALVRRHAGQVSLAHGLAAYTAAIRALEQLLREPQLGPGVRSSARRSISRLHAHVAKQLVLSGSPAAARRHAMQSLARTPWHAPAWRWGLVALARSTPLATRVQAGP